MRRGGPVLAAVVAALMVLAAAASLFVASRSAGQAWSTLEGSIRLRQARLEVSSAQRSLGGSDIRQALASINRANRTALRISSLTDRIVGLLSPTGRSASGAVALARRGAGSASSARRLVVVISGDLGAIAGYQRAGSADAGSTNQALRRILRALRETNRSFPVP